MNTLNPILGALRSDPSVAALLRQIKGTPSFSLELEGPEGAARGMILALIRETLVAAEARTAAPFPPDHPLLAVVPTEKEAEELAADLDSCGVPALIFPWWGALPYRDAAPIQAVFGERTKALAALAGGWDSGEGAAPFIIMPERAFLTPLPPPDYFRSLLLPVKTGDSLNTQTLAAALVERGYTRTPRVQLHGEFALRGEVLDIFMGGDEEACRILLDFDRVESIKRFQPLDPNQGTGGERLESLFLRPLKEVIWKEDTLSALKKNVDRLPEFPAGTLPPGVLGSGENIPGEELLFSLAFSAPAASILDYLGSGALVFFLDRERLENAQDALEEEYRGLFLQARRASQRTAQGGHVSMERLLPAPERVLLGFDGLAGAAQSLGINTLSFMSIRGGEKKRLRVSCEPSRSFFGNIAYLREEFSSLTGQGWTVVVAAESGIQAARIRELLSGGGLSCITVIGAPLSGGFSLPESKFMAVQENEIFGRRRRPPRSLSKVKSTPIDTFVELNPGDYVVHVNYGIGLFRGIERIRALGHERDYVRLEYQDDESIMVPIEQVNLVQRYIGSEGNPPRLDKIGSKNWENRKSRVKKSVEDIAERLIALYSKRRTAPGFAFPRDSEWQLMFEAAFPFEETEDQLRCVEEIKTDMESPHPMDRLVCGDVGYGKTEVAVRACFKAVMGGKQAAFLASTTILAEQHYDNFQERFGAFPVRLAMLSRFVRPAETRRIIAALAKGEVDVLVGTHRIIQKDVVYRDLGLLVVDEEQRFGVRDKERLKELKTNVDCLTLSATPIPRTLHMSLLKIRDMSLLATPPQNRHPIETIIGEFDKDRLAAAIRAEAERGGQVFFLHNRIETLRETRIMLERLLPELLVETAHGRMEGRELEEVMHRFIHGGFHILVSTTIIENGIDIPNVNTIIIDRADMYGISQLYQLRGRVGRSDRVAYAYLFYPPGRALSELAMKRLEVISDFTELGSGFKIAMKDLEIRGAGNLLGREQSGDIYSVGFDLYLRLLDDAVRRLENENYEAETETFLELEYSGFIPDSYVEETSSKMEVYKKIAAVRTREELDNLHGELADRFGPPPDEAASLLALAEIRIMCRDLAVSSLREKAGTVRVEFGKVSRVAVDRLLRLMKESAGRVRLDPREPNVLLLKTGSIGLKEKSEFIREKLATLTG
ncbi:MAG: transcription-repair coupling factor [Treponema sp.]|jgi:transcription-repair coupling factor (superfamily II helicase)|nr:transcription-repair coupling factor [Treponema sp.]